MSTVILGCYWLKLKISLYTKSIVGKLEPRIKQISRIKDLYHGKDFSD